MSRTLCPFWVAHFEHIACWLLLTFPI